MRDTMTRLGWIALTLLSLSCALTQAYFESEEFQSYSPEQQQVIRQLVDFAEVQAFLAQYPEWSAFSYAVGEDDWKTDFYDPENWIGYAHLNLSTGELYDSILPVMLSPEAYQTGRQKIEALVFSDAEVLARLGNPDDWYYDVSHDHYGNTWSMTFWRGLDAVGLSFWVENERFHLADIYDAHALSEEQVRNAARDKAIELTYTLAEGVGEALEGIYNWYTYAEKLEQHIWSVEFSADGKSLFYAVVDVAEQVILETQVP